MDLSCAFKVLLVSLLFHHIDSRSLKKLQKSLKSLKGRVSMLEKIVGVNCPTGYYKHNQSCYGIKTVPTTWADALSQCKVEDATLIAIKNGSVQRFIRRYLQKIIKRQEIFTDGFFTAGKYNSAWIWDDRQGVLNYNKWCRTKPNLFRWTPSANKGCVQLWTSCHFKWNIVPCEEKRPFICVKRLKRW